ncbi:MAG: radical SAM protein [Syntrophobacteraceae bacterium]
MKSTPNLELHLVHSCNLVCESCSHYSNQGHKGVVSLDEADRWMKLWNRRISPQMLSLLGGEPTLHPQLTELLSLARRNWPGAMLRLVTNGFLLHRHPTLPTFLAGDPNAYVCLSIHHGSQEYLEKLRPTLELVTCWIKQYGIKVDSYQAYNNWTRRYHGLGSQMKPFADGQPRRSWENCTARCPQLYEGTIWKCPPLAYMRLQEAKYHLSDKWKPFLSYQPLEPSCSDEALEEFFAREEESCCGLCSAKPERFNLPVPLPSRRGRITRTTIQVLQFLGIKAKR